MNDIRQIKALLDACTLYPAVIRDLLLCMAELNLFKPFWTDEINEEWISNLLAKRPDLNRQNLGKSLSAMNNAFPEANVTGYSYMINKLKLPDPKDRHVLAAAIKCHATVIITTNIKDFPDKSLAPFGIESQSPDSFVRNMIARNADTVLTAFRNQVENLRNPPLTTDYVLQLLQNVGLSASSNLLRKLSEKPS